MDADVSPLARRHKPSLADAPITAPVPHGCFRRKTSLRYFEGASAAAFIPMRSAGWGSDSDIVPGNSLDPERLDGAGRVAPGRTQVRSDFSSRHMVGATPPHVPRPLSLRRLFDLGRVPGGALRVRAVSF